MSGFTHRHRLPGWLAFRAALAGWVVFGLFACAGAPEPPRGLPGLPFGSPPPAGLHLLAVPLPGELAGILEFHRLPGQVEFLPGLALAEPVLAFYKGRFFSVSAELPDTGTTALARKNLDRILGQPYCRDLAGATVSLWRRGDVDAVLETPDSGPARLMVRYRPVADELPAGKIAAGTEGEGLP